jgi:subtilisin family serine protease
MGMRGTCCTAAALVLIGAPAAQADRAMSVGYSTPSALHGLHVSSRIPALRIARVEVSNARTLRARPGIRFVRALVPRTRSDSPIPLATPGSDWQRAATHLDDVPATVLDGAASVTIAVVDTGADVSSPVLASRHLGTYNVTTGAAGLQDTIGHGTFVTSLAASFGGQARLLVVQANREATFSDVDEAAGIVWATDHGARIINLSLSGSQTSAAERAAIRYATKKGVLLVAAAGNGGQSGNRASYPAALLGREGIVVGASTTTGTRAPFSTTGRYVDLLAPGVGVLGALAAGCPNTLFTPTPATAGYGFGSGTSYAAPEVAGAAALVWAASPLLSATAVATMLTGTASGHGTWSTELGSGTLDVGAAVTKALASVAPAPTRIVRR